MVATILVSVVVSASVAAALCYALIRRERLRLALIMLSVAQALDAAMKATREHPGAGPTIH